MYLPPELNGNELGYSALISVFRVEDAWFFFGLPTPNIIVEITIRASVLHNNMSPPHLSLTI